MEYGVWSMLIGKPSVLGVSRGEVFSSPSSTFSLIHHQVDTTPGQLLKISYFSDFLLSL